MYLSLCIYKINNVQWEKWLFEAICVGAMLILFVIVQIQYLHSSC